MRNSDVGGMMAYFLTVDVSLLSNAQWEQSAYWFRCLPQYAREALREHVSIAYFLANDAMNEKSKRRAKARIIQDPLNRPSGLYLALAQRKRGIQSVPCL
jgi:hypothetical protein